MVEVPTERVVTVDRVVEKQVVVTVPTVEVVERRVEVPVMHERVVQVPVEPRESLGKGGKKGL